MFDCVTLWPTSPLSIHAWQLLTWAMFQHALPRGGQAPHPEPRQAGGGHQGGRGPLAIPGHLQSPLPPPRAGPGPR